MRVRKSVWIGVVMVLPWIVLLCAWETLRSPGTTDASPPKRARSRPRSEPQRKAPATDSTSAARADSKTHSTRRAKGPTLRIPSIYLSSTPPGHAEIEGRVTDALSGEPVAGAEVAVVSHDHSLGHLSAHTGRDGKYSVHGVRAGKNIVVVLAKGYARARLDPVHDPFLFSGWRFIDLQGPKENEAEVYVTGGGDAKRDFHLMPAASVSGTVVDPSGEPVPGARLTVRYRDSTTTRATAGGFDLRPETDEHGRFRIDHLLPGRGVTLEASAKGLADSDSAPFDLEPRQETSGIRIDMSSGSTLTGVVVNAAGAPIEGARVKLERPVQPLVMSVHVKIQKGGPSKSGVSSPPVTVSDAPKSNGGDVGTIGIGGGLDSPPQPAWTTDANGRFRARGLHPGKFVMEIHAPGYAKRTVPHVTIPKTGTTDLGTIILEKGLVISGRVAGAGGDLLARVSVQAIREGDSGPESGGWIFAFAYPDGSFSLKDLAPGKYSIDFSLRGYESVHLEHVEAGARNVSVTLKKGGSISGSVLGPDGSPAADVEVEAEPEGSAGSAGSGDFHLGKTDAKGRFEIGGLPNGTYTLTYDGLGSHFSNDPSASGASAYQPEVVHGVRSGTTDVEVHMERGSTIAGVVQDESGAPIRAALITEEPTSSNEPSPAASACELFGNRVGRDGRFTIFGLAPARYRISVSADGYTPTSVVVDVPPNTESLQIVMKKE